MLASSLIRKQYRWNRAAIHTKITASGVQIDDNTIIKAPKANTKVVVKTGGGSYVCTCGLFRVDVIFGVFTSKGGFTRHFVLMRSRRISLVLVDTFSVTVSDDACSRIFVRRSNRFFIIWVVGVYSIGMEQQQKVVDMVFRPKRDFREKFGEYGGDFYRKK